MALEDIVALEEMNSIRWVKDCCLQAIYDCNRMGIEAAATNERTVADWNILLQANHEHVPLPADPKIQKQKKPLPDLLEYFSEEITVPWIDYCIGNLADLAVELARNELITRIIPKCCSGATTHDNEEEKETNQENGENGGESEQSTTTTTTTSRNPTTIKDCLLKAYLDLPISVTTTWRWLRRLGFHFDNRKKSFFVDGHERPNVVCHQRLLHQLSKKARTSNAPVDPGAKRNCGKVEVRK